MGGARRREVPRAPAEPISFAGCGIIEGQRRCSKREAAAYGYGEGRDPITFGVKVVEELRDSDE